MLNAKQTAYLLGVSVRTIYRWVEKRIIPYERRVGRYYFDIKEVKKKIDEKNEVK